MDSPITAAIRNAYRRGEEDEALSPIVAVDPSDRPVGRMKGGDYVVFYDIRGEREIELTQSLIEKDFSHFPVKADTILNFVTMIEYHSSLDVRVAFPPQGKIENTLNEVLSRAGLRTLKIAESEKAVHIGYFMNGKSEQAFPDEERIIVPSPQGVSSYTQVPDMSARLVVDKLEEKLGDSSYRFIAANLANVDVIGHIEDKAAVLRAVESVDRELGRVIDLCRAAGVALIITADHGTVEEWLYPDGTVNTGHTKNRVPFILADFSRPDPGLRKLRADGELADVAPTVLSRLGLPIPPEMTGRNLAEDPQAAGTGSARIVLLILDGWGMREERKGNMIAEAATPQFDRAWERFPHSLLEAAGEAVGMPAGTVGNSESGHLHLGAGRRIFLDRVRIDKAVEDGSFFRNEAFLWVMDKAKAEGKTLHLLGIVSFYSSHGTIDHLFALLRLARQKGLRDVCVHCLIGRRGERPESGAAYVADVEEMCGSLGVGRVVTVMGRHWALDREHNWALIEKAYRALVFGEGSPAALPSARG